MLMDIQDIATFTDYFILCSGSSERMIESLADAVLENAKKEFQMIGKKEGYAQGGWVLVDLGDVIVHLFSPEQRDYYRLEELWSQGKILLRLQ
ncbi:ribosome-associated protein IOJAP [Bellilinea caldifistulae]|uniref:Ribosome-associated protein IOJAP n=1 Tax=Bellilinea caldifistulae TaxID=360411 RepID=A0A0P6X5L9_9CHLR|nr:ribosome-associated protein IOJAP [Bellilinea caldifistulae]